ncbi:MAG: hypothetical protein JRI22_15545 [Deltaproteobacteria bacterium]|nr:hypothetical protein [Deltaproteobacteria bacterium]
MVAIFVVMTIMAFVAIDLMIQTLERRKKASLQPETIHHHTAGIYNLILPLVYFFHPGHTWAQVEKTGMVRVGLDSFAQKLIGNIDTIELPEVGKEVKQGQPLFSIRQGRRSAAFVSPVNGKIASTNNHLEPNLIKKEPYSSGWIAEVEPDSLSDDLSRLKIGKDAVLWMKKEIKKFLDFSWARVPAPAIVGQTAQDGGFPVEGILETMDDETWDHFETQFLQSRVSDDPAIFKG